MGVSPNDVSAMLVLENGFDPKKPRFADNGLGWADCKTILVLVSIRLIFDRAARPRG
jgi:hypothetical protein